MGENVVGLHGPVSVQADEPEPALIETLEALLVQAKSGTLRGLAYAVAEAKAGPLGGGIGCGWHASVGYKLPLVAAVHALGYRMAAMAADQSG